MPSARRLAAAVLRDKAAVVQVAAAISAAVAMDLLEADDLAAAQDSLAAAPADLPEADGLAVAAVGGPVADLQAVESNSDAIPLKLPLYLPSC